jgi:uncharacterized repeat protein (TIGR01451 family)
MAAAGRPKAASILVVLALACAQVLLAAGVSRAAGIVDLSIAKTGDPASVPVGETLTYTLSASNAGPSQATDVTVTDDLPDDVTLVSSSTTKGTCSPAPGGLTCALGPLDAAEDVTVTIVVTPTAAGTITNVATITSALGDIELNSEDNSDSVDTTVTPVTDLTVEKSASPTTVAVGQSLTYTIAVTNGGPSGATGVTATDTLPGSVTFVSASAGCSESGGTVTCDFGSVADDATETATITATPTAEGTITNSVTVTGNESDPDAANNSDSLDTTVTAASTDLSVIKTDSPDPAQVGQNVTYTLTIANAGPSPASGVTVTDTLPAGVTLVSASAGCSEAAGTVTCDIGALGINASVTRQIVVTPTAAGTITNTASVSGSQADPNSANNTSTATTTVTAESGLFTDPDDVGTPLDLQNISHDADGTTITYDIDTFEDWTSDQVDDFEWVLFTTGDAAADYFVDVFWNGTALVGEVSNAAGDLVGAATVTRPDTDALEVVFSRSVIGNPGSYDYIVLSWFDTNGDGDPDVDEVDAAPNAGQFHHDLPAVFRFSSASFSVGEGGGSATITVTRTGTGPGTATVDFATSNGTATAGSDYTAASGTLSFGATETAKTFTVPITDDTTVESAETVNLALSGPSAGAFLGSASTAILTISDNDSSGGGGGGGGGGGTTDPVIRLAGVDRIDTAIAISRDLFDPGDASAVVLARSDVFADSLPGTPLAVTRDAPLLLTGPTALDSRTRSEIQRVLPAGRTVYLLGGTGALSAGVESSIRSLGYVVVRLSGSDRYQTAVKIAENLGNPTTVLLATGVNFPDGLSAGAAAAILNAVVLLTNGSSMPPSTASYLSQHPGTVYAVGGPAASARPSAIAIVGADRYETARKVADRFFSAPFVVGLASGENFPDALSGGSHIGGAGPLLLVRQADLPSTTKSYLLTHHSSILFGFVYGGTGAVSEGVRQGAQAAINGNP